MFLCIHDEAFAVEQTILQACKKCVVGSSTFGIRWECNRWAIIRMSNVTVLHWQMKWSYTASAADSTTYAREMTSDASDYVATSIAYARKRLPSIFAAMRITNMFSYLAWVLPFFNFWCYHYHARKVFTTIHFCVISYRCTLSLVKFCTRCTDTPCT